VATGHGFVVVQAVEFLDLVAVSIVIHEMDCVAWHEHPSALVQAGVRLY
jgi:hypothetical protein